MHKITAKDRIDIVVFDMWCDRLKTVIIFKRHDRADYLDESNKNAAVLQVIYMVTPQNNLTLTTQTPSELEERFHPPAGWTWKALQRDGYFLRYGYATPDLSPPKSLVVCLPGLSEFCEKFFEITRDLLSQGHAVLVIDWRGQGLSSRYLKNPHKRHSQGFRGDALDLKAIIEDCPLINNETALHMLAHSMGGNIGLRFLEASPDVFTTASFSAPLAGLHVFSKIPRCIASAASGFLNATFPRSYAPTGGDWSPSSRDLTSAAIFSQDDKRAKVHNSWMIKNPALQVGHITNRWLRDAYNSCLDLQHHTNLEAIDIPCFFAIAGHEFFVDNTMVRHISERVSGARLLEFPDARHEILMEKDTLRGKFMAEFYSLINQTIVD